MTRRIFFNQFNGSFTDFRTKPLGATMHRAWKDMTIKARRVTSKKILVRKARVEAHAEWGPEPSITVDTIYLDDAGEEVSRGRTKKCDNAAAAYDEAKARVDSLS